VGNPFQSIKDKHSPEYENKLFNENKTMTQTIEIGMHPDLAMSVIKDQAGSLEHAIREAVQNGIDSPGSKYITVEINSESAKISDDGDGMDLTQEDMLSFLKDLGNSSKGRDDDSTIGQFGMGMGQVLAKAKVTIRTQDSIVKFDIKNRGLTGEISHDNEYVEGFEVTLDWYESEVPDKDSHEWDSHIESLKERFAFINLAMGKTVTLNGEEISNAELDNYVNNETYVETRMTHDAHIKICHDSLSRVKVYSNGMFVKELSRDGFGGVIVSSGNLDLDFSRNDIKSGCPKWDSITDTLNDMEECLLRKIPQSKLNKNAMKRMSQIVIADSGGEYADREIFQLANEQMTSYNEIMKAPQVGFSDNERGADRLVERGYMVLSRYFGTNIKLLHRENNLPEQFDVTAKANELDLITESRTYDDDHVRDNVPTRQKKKLCFARYLANEIGIPREINYGEDDSKVAWTDGKSYIILTEKAWNRKRTPAWMSQIYHILIHEWAHDTDSSVGTMYHGEEYSMDYRKKMEENWDTFYDVVEELDKHGSVSGFLKKKGYFHKDL